MQQQRSSVFPVSCMTCQLHERCGQTRGMRGQGRWYANDADIVPLVSNSIGCFSGKSTSRATDKTPDLQDGEVALPA